MVSTIGTAVTSNEHQNLSGVMENAAISVVFSFRRLFPFQLQAHARLTRNKEIIQVQTEHNNNKLLCLRLLQVNRKDSASPLPRSNCGAAALKCDETANAPQRSGKQCSRHSERVMRCHICAARASDKGPSQS